MIGVYLRTLRLLIDHGAHAARVPDQLLDGRVCYHADCWRGWFGNPKYFDWAWLHLLVLAVMQVRCNHDAACRAGQACTSHGLCRASGRACIAATPADCQQSLDCSLFRTCTLENGACKATDGDCQLSNDCRIHGVCRAVANRCGVSTHEDCRRSDGCRQWGACGTWVDVAQDDGSKHALCVPQGELDCVNSERCKTNKECRYIASRKICVPAEE
jgi:hypothetical protein